MANYNITITSESEYVGPPLYVIYSTYMSSAGPLDVGDTLTITYTKYAGGQSYVTVEGIDSSIFSPSADVVLDDGESVVLTAIAAGNDQIVANFPSSNFQDQNRIITVEAAAPTIVAPTVNDSMGTHIVATTAAATTTVDINLSSSGSGGTLEYNVSTTTTLPTSGWTTGNPSVTRGTSYYLWARRSSSDYDRSNTTLSIPYLAADTAITTTWPSASLATTETSFSVDIASGSTPTTYSVRTGSYSGTVVGSRTGNGSITVSDTPAAGSSKTYYLTAHVVTGSGGNGNVSSIETEVVVKAAEGSSEEEGGGTAEYGVEIFNSSGVKTMAVGDTLTFISGSGTTSISRAGGLGSTGSTTVFALGARVGDIPTASVSTINAHALSLSVTSSNTVSVSWEQMTTSTFGSETYTITVINLGD